MTLNTLDKDQLLAQIAQGWAELNAYLDSLTETQASQPTDAAGWTVKDHVIHLGVWEDGIWALLNYQSRHEQMGLDLDTFQSRDFDRMNAVIQKQHRDLSWDEVRARATRMHTRVMETVTAFTADQLLLPQSTYANGVNARPDAVVEWVKGDTYEHYAQHLPWMQAIVSGQFDADHPKDRD